MSDVTVSLNEYAISADFDGEVEDDQPLDSGSGQPPEGDQP